MTASDDHNEDDEPKLDFTSVVADAQRAIANCHAPAVTAYSCLRDWFEGPFRLKLDFTSAHGNRTTACYALHGKTHRRLQDWLARRAIPASAKDMDDWLQHNGGRLDRADGPAFVETSRDGFSLEMWYRDGQAHRTNSPAVVVTRPGRSRREECWHNGLLHRADGPAVVSTSPAGTRYEAWYRKGKPTANPAARPGVTILPPQP